MRLNGTFCSSKNLPWELSLAASNSRSNTICTSTPRFLVCATARAVSSLANAYTAISSSFCAFSISRIICAEHLPCGLQHVCTAISAQEVPANHKRRPQQIANSHPLFFISESCFGSACFLFVSLHTCQE